MAQQIHTKKAGETLVGAVNFSPRLIDGDLLTGTPTATVSPSGPTVNNAQRNTTALTMLRETVAVNKAVLFTIAGGTAGTTYVVTVTAQSVSGQTMVERCTVKVEA